MDFKAQRTPLISPAPNLPAELSSRIHPVFKPQFHPSGLNPTPPSPWEPRSHPPLPEFSSSPHPTLRLSLLLPGRFLSPPSPPGSPREPARVILMGSDGSAPRAGEVGQGGQIPPGIAASSSRRIWGLQLPLQGMLREEIPHRGRRGWDLSQIISSPLKPGAALKLNFSRSREAPGEPRWKLESRARFSAGSRLSQSRFVPFGVSFSSAGSRDSHGNAEPALADGSGAV